MFFIHPPPTMTQSHLCSPSGNGAGGLVRQLTRKRRNGSGRRRATWRPGDLVNRSPYPVCQLCSLLLLLVLALPRALLSSVLFLLVRLPFCSTPCSNPTSPSSYRHRPHRSPADAIVSPVGSSCQRPPRRPVWCRIAHLGAVWRS